MAYSKVFIVDIGSSKSLDEIHESALVSLAHIFPVEQTRRADFLQTLKLTVPELPWPRKTNMGMINPNRTFEFLPAALSVDPLTGGFCQGFRVQIGAGDCLTGFRLRRRALRAIELQPVQERGEVKPEDLLRIVFARVPSVSELEFVYTESGSGHLASLADVETTAICQKRYLSNSLSPVLLWELEDGVSGEWLNVGLRDNDSRGMQVIFDPALFSIFLLTETEIIKSEALPNNQKRKQLLKRIKEAKAAKIKYEIFSASMVLSTDAQTNEDRAEFRKEKCVCDAEWLEVLEDKQIFTTNDLISDAKNLGVNVTELEPVLASRTRTDIDIEKIPNDRFMIVISQINPPTIVVQSSNLQRITYLLTRLVANGETDYYQNVRHVEDKLYFLNPQRLLKASKD